MDFHGGRGHKNGLLESEYAVSPSDAHFKGPFGLRELGPASTIGRQPSIRQTPEVAATRAGLLGVALRALTELAIRAGDRSAGNGHQVASNGIQAVLAVEIEAQKTRTSTHRTGNP